MGGGYYGDDDRSVQSASAGQAYSTQADQILRSNRTMHGDLSPMTKILVTDVRNPIVVAIDVTGSMGNWSKIIYDKLPMFYGQIMLQGYLEDPALSFAGVGDANSDQAPLQVTDFKQGRDIDDVISKLWLESGGGGQNYESYELAAYFYARRAKMPNATKAFFFFTGDEGCYPAVLKDFVKDIIGDDLRQSVPTREIFEELKHKFDVFFLHKPYYDATVDAQMVAKWEALIGPEHVLHLEDPKAVVDMMLGAIAVGSGSRSLEDYLRDMQDRGQSEKRIGEIQTALRPLSLFLSGHGRVAPREPPQSSAPAPATTPKPLVSTGVTTPEMEQSKQQLEKIRATVSDFPQQFLCPITQEPFADPVFTVDGHTYERIAIEAWLEEHDTSPLTNKPLESKMLIPNHALRGAIADYIQKHAH